MGHLTAKGAFPGLRKRLDLYSLGAPETQAVYEVLKTIFDEEEARIAAQMPMTFIGLKGIARRTGVPESELEPKLARMAEKGLMWDFEFGGKVRYMLPPTIVGLFEFSMMRTRTDINQKDLAHSIHEVLVGDPTYVDAASDLKTFPLRVVPHESSLPAGTFTEVMDYEKASQIVENAGRWAVGLCHCRHVTHHMEEDCQKFKMESCMSIGPGADWITRHKLGREMSKTEALEMLAESREKGLVQMADNVQHNPTFICNCCGCCCEVLVGFKKFNDREPVFSSNYIAAIEPASCTGCGKCAKACPVDAIEMVAHERTVGGKKRKKLATIRQDLCIGCGVCHAECKFESLTMEQRAVRRITPETTFKRVLMAALETGKLHHLLADPTTSWSARAANVLLGAILNLPPSKQLLLRDQVKSRFLDAVVYGAKRAGIAGSDM